MVARDAAFDFDSDAGLLPLAVAGAAYGLRYRLLISDFVPLFACLVVYGWLGYSGYISSATMSLKVAKFLPQAS